MMILSPLKTHTGTDNLFLALVRYWLGLQSVQHPNDT